MKMFKQIWQKSEFRRTDFPKPFALMSMAWLSQKGAIVLQNVILSASSRKPVHGHGGF